MLRLEEAWQVRCEGRAATDVDLAAAMTSAVGLADRELPIVAGQRAALRRWVGRQTAQIEREAG